jgi:hypothetical protein
VLILAWDAANQSASIEGKKGYHQKTNDRRWIAYSAWVLKETID